MAKEVTKAPTGLSIVRNENQFTASWKIGDKDYADGQYFQYAIDTTGKVSWLPTKNTAIGTKTTSRVITTINKSNYYPNTDSAGNNKPFLYSICFRVAGNRKTYKTRSGKKKKTHKPSASAWVRKDFVVNPPKKPTLTYVLGEELTNVCTFSWSAPYESNDSYLFTDVQWQTILVKNSSEADGGKLDWSNAEGGAVGAEGSKTITEDTSILYKDGNSYTRWFRARSRGPRGVYNADGSNGWVYEKHVYALPHQADVTGTSASETEEGGFQCTVDWTAGQSGGQNPIDKTTAQYTITTPDGGLTCPSGVSWKDANISRDTEAGDAAVFSIDDQLGKDQCLFIRVNTQHDSNITYGKPQLSYVGFLKDPSGLSVSTDSVTHKATITATNNSAVEDSILIVRYVPSSGNPIDVGVIPHGSTSVTVQCPNWDDQGAIAFEVYAIVGTAMKQTRADGVDSYSVTVGMRSQNTVSEGGAVPVAPKNVSVSRVEGKSDTVRVDWDWPWSEAGSAEISWSDHDDAWESTDAPESFVISNLHASHWNISGLETGKTWYVRVRLIAGNMDTSEAVTYGPWSDVSQGAIDLSSAPNKPVLILSNSIIPEDGSTIASWVYTTTDNTAQAYAEVAIVENGGYIPIAHSLTAQHVTIPAQAENYTLSTGNIYNLVCRVKSASGKLSEWSDIVSLTVAKPISCEIVQTSLVRQRIEANPREFGPDDLLTFETELEEDFAKAQVNLEPIQEGSGTPSPSNVRPIRGHGGVTVYDSPTQNAEDGESYSVDFNVSLTPTSTDTTPYSFKAVGDVYGDRLEDKIVGGTVAWNQLIKNGNFENSSLWEVNDKSKGDFTVSNGELTYTQTTDGVNRISSGLYGSKKLNHKYLLSCQIKPSKDIYFTLVLAYNYANSIDTKLASGGVWNNISGIITSKEDSDKSRKWIFPQDSLSEGDSYIVKNFMLFDLTQMFGSTIADYIYSLEQSQAGAGVAWFKKLFPKDYYAYNAGELLSVEGLQSHVMRDADNSVIGNYPLDSSLTLRGIPKLDASNNLYYDGDEYTSDGKVKRKYGVVELSELAWTSQAYNGVNYFFAKADKAYTNNAQVSVFGYCTLYPIEYIVNLPSNDKTIVFNSLYYGAGFSIVIRDDSISTVDALKTALTGKGEVVYALATPTTETATPYTNPQIVSKYGTLEYVTNSIVPVGHKTTYLTRDIFGGYVDLISGKLVVDRKTILLDGTQSFGDSTPAQNPNGGYNAWFKYDDIGMGDVKRSNPVDNPKLSNRFVYTPRKATAQNDIPIGSFSGNVLSSGNADDWIVFAFDSSMNTYEKISQWFKDNNTQICYELATPQTYQLTPQQVNTLVGINNVWSEQGQVEVRIAESMRDVDTLTKMPLSIKVTGAGDGGITTIVVERAEDYLMVRPDETNFNGNKGEMVLQTSPPLVGINQVSFTTDDLIGPMDDGAVYNIVATVQDGLGQKDSVTLPFEVHWEHQAEEPSAEIVIDETNLIAYIKPIAPVNATPEDVADIYRLSADKPELIVEGAIFGETYVDPYPALGDMGGHRIVTRTKNGDYITEGNQIAMIDSPELGVNPIENEDLLNVIDFEGRQIRFYWETDYSNTWAKDFQETTYLGGSIEGDWNPAVSRSGTLSSKAITVLDQEMLKDVRRLADYPGICHVRTADGSSYAADVQVSENYTDDEKGMVTNYSLSITKVGSQGFDGMTKEQWDEENPAEVEEEV